MDCYLGFGVSPCTILPLALTWIASLGYNWFLAGVYQWCSSLSDCMWFHIRTRFDSTMFSSVFYHRFLTLYQTIGWYQSNLQLEGGHCQWYTLCCLGTKQWTYWTILLFEPVESSTSNSIHSSELLIHLCSDKAPALSSSYLLCSIRKYERCPWRLDSCRYLGSQEHPCSIAGNHSQGFHLRQVGMSTLQLRFECTCFNLSSESLLVLDQGLR